MIDSSVAGMLIRTRRLRYGRGWLSSNHNSVSWRYLGDVKAFVMVEVSGSTVCVRAYTDEMEYSTTLRIDPDQKRTIEWNKKLRQRATLWAKGAINANMEWS